jgi:hypothetical protein
MKAKYTQEIEVEGWTRDIPVGPTYRIACCDCGLVHDLVFWVEDDQIYMRAQRNRRATAQRRRHLAPLNMRWTHS